MPGSAHAFLKGGSFYIKSKILIIDDETAILHALQIFLEQQGYGVETVAGYNNLFENTKSEDLPDIIIMDVLLSNEDGRVVAQELKSDPKTKHIPIVMISAHPGADKTTMRTGADAFLAKPFDASILLDIIQRLTKKS